MQLKEKYLKIDRLKQKPFYYDEATVSNLENLKFGKGESKKYVDIFKDLMIEKIIDLN